MLERQNARKHWLEDTLSSSFDIHPLVNDASFRQYFRIITPEKSWVLMDAPPDKESINEFINAQSRLLTHGLPVPQVHAQNMHQGFILLEDFGNTLLLDVLQKNITAPSTPTSRDLFAGSRYYKEAITLLIRMHDTHHADLPCFNASKMLEELALYTSWFLEQYRNISLRADEYDMLATTFDWLTRTIEKQPYGFMHRDFHSRNIMVLDTTPNAPPFSLGIIDFQDAMQGPLCYDLVSLLKDCYIAWPESTVQNLVRHFYQSHPYNNRLGPIETCYDAFELCGLQRHLKVLGIFSRLHIRDKKDRYLQDIPRVLEYVMQYLNKNLHPELQHLWKFMKNKVLQS